MNKNIASAFENKKAFIGFVTAGDPDLDTSRQILLEMAKNGCDLIEVGIPFSDPIAEGPVIQEANIRALAQGVTTDKVFDLVAEVSAQMDIPLVFMTYLNVLFRYGYDRFCRRAADSGISGVIVPDLPYEEKARAVRCCQKVRHCCDLFGSAHQPRAGDDDRQGGRGFLVPGVLHGCNRHPQQD